MSNTPEAIREDEAQTEFERAGRYKRFIHSLLIEDKRPDRRYEKAMTALRLLLGRHWLKPGPEVLRRTAIVKTTYRLPISCFEELRRDLALEADRGRLLLRADAVHA